MIKVTRLDNREVVVNADLVEFVEATPETIISTTTGKKLVIRESVDEVIRRALEYRRRALPLIKTAANAS
ncbi:MAG: flagellar FlbD family protein [Candidatus Coatesbacteria bacterium]